MIQLFVKTEYSFGKTFASLTKLIETLKKQGCTVAGIVDDNTWGHVEFFNSCKKVGIKPILGVECVVSDNDFPTKMKFLASNLSGLSELYRIISKSSHQPLRTRQGVIPRLYRNDVYNMSDDILKFAGDITDGVFLVDVKSYLDLSPSSRVLNNKKIKLSVEYGIDIVSVSDNAYCLENDKQTFELISKVGIKTTPQHILTELEHQNIAEQISGLCEAYELPRAPMIHADGDLRGLCFDGIKNRNIPVVLIQKYDDRANYELELIKSKNFESYFIIVADLVKFAKEQKILVGPGRGSAAGSLVCYLLGITEIDPIINGLMFERFIDINRNDLPDIDIDFPDDKRQIIFNYMADKYGQNNVAHIGTISRFRPKSALLSVCKVLHIPPSETFHVKQSMIERAKEDERVNNCIEDAFKTTKAGVEFIKDHPEAVRTQYIEGHASHCGVHAAGLLVCNDEITNYCSVDSNGIAHLEKGSAEELGLLKIDVLGLRTLTILSDTGVNIDFYNLQLNDLKVFDIFNNNKLCGIFQFEGNSLRAISEKINNFNSIDDIDAVTALARPGPMGSGLHLKWLERKNGKPYEPLHPLVAKHMSETYGLPIYQEQTLSIVKEIGLFDWKETSSIRKIIAKSKGEEAFNHYWKKFKTGAVSQGMTEKQAKTIWDMIVASGSYSMNKAHTRSYAVLSYWCAYLKTYHPLEFAMANLRHSKDDESSLALLREIHKEGISFTPFDLELSEINWCVKNGRLIGGFTNLTCIAEKKAEKLVSDRNSGRLTTKQLETIKNSKNKFADIFPLQTLYGHLYEFPRTYGVSGNIVHVCDITESMNHGEEVIIIGELISKTLRNANEPTEIKKRSGEVVLFQLDFVDIKLSDDTGVIGGRIGRKDFDRIGRGFLENVPNGSHIMLRVKLFNHIKFLFVQKIVRIDNDEKWSKTCLKN